MTSEQAKREIDSLDFYLQNHTDDYGEESHTAMMMAIKALEQQTCEDAVSREAVKDKLLKLCNGLEGIFANIRMENQDESVCGLCEYDCPAPYECPGFDNEDCFKLADEIRYKWQSTKDLPPVNPAKKQELCEDFISRQAVLDIFADNADATRPYSTVWEKIRDLPSVNPQPICEEREKGECPYYAG